MKRVRIIPRLDIKGANLVKGIHLEGLRVLGLPERFSLNYFHEGADELIYIDSVASLYGRNNLENIIRRTAEDVFIPITVGGGIRTIEDIRRILRSGADKVAINTAAISNPKLISKAAEVFGSQCIVVSIQAMKRGSRKYEAYTDNAREPTGRDVFKWAKQAVELGAGEILITSIDQEGTGEGFDIELIAEIVESVNVPVIACGGAGHIKHFEDLINQCDVAAVSASSIFHYHIIKKFGVEKRQEGNVEYLKTFTSSPSVLKRLEPVSVSGLRKHLIDLKIPCASKNLPGDFVSEAESLKREILVRKKNKIPHVVMVDYGRSNLFSIEHAFRALGANVEITNDPEKIIRADRLVIGGVGAFANGMKGMRDNSLIDPIKEFVKKGKPVLGICLGMQLFMDEGEELGLSKGMGLIRGRVIRLKERADENHATVKVPHIGWNQINPPREGRNGAGWSNSMLLQGISPDDYVYFVHSYTVVPDDPDTIVAETVYGANRFCSIIVKDNIAGCQFHPERSGLVGLNMFKNFLLNQQSGN